MMPTFTGINMRAKVLRSSVPQLLLRAEISSRVDRFRVPTPLPSQLAFNAARNSERTTSRTISGNGR